MPPIALIGPSGAGKSTLAKQLIARHPDLEFIRSYTTRAQRSVDDTSHIFITDAEFDRMLAEGQFIGTIEAFGGRFGLIMPPADVIPLLLIRSSVATQFRQLYPTGVVIELDAPFEVLNDRLTERGDIDRINQYALQQETDEGRRLADFTIDTRQTIDACVREIEAAIASRTH